MRVPIRVKPRAYPERSATLEDVGPVSDARPAVVDSEEIVRSRDAGPLRAQSESPTHRSSSAEEISAEKWRDQALRLQAEIDNFRKRQRRLAEEQIIADRERLLRGFLSVADDLQRALVAANGTDTDNVRRGLEITHQKFMKLLKQEGVESIDARNQLFDPTWHEAVSVVQQGGAEELPHTVADVLETGYRLGDRLLRPAKVVVTR